MLQRGAKARTFLKRTVASSFVTSLASNGSCWGYRKDRKSRDILANYIHQGSVDHLITLPGIENAPVSELQFTDAQVRDYILMIWLDSFVSNTTASLRQLKALHSHIEQDDFCSDADSEYIPTQLFLGLRDRDGFDLAM
jgi:molybdate-binding protein